MAKKNVQEVVIKQSQKKVMARRVLSYRKACLKHLIDELNQSVECNMGDKSSNKKLNIAVSNYEYACEKLKEALQS